MAWMTGVMPNGRCSRSSAATCSASSSLLLGHLRQSSDGLLERAADTQRRVGHLLAASEWSAARFADAHSQLAHLSATQFIENRVYDEEVAAPMPKQESAEPSKANREARLVGAVGVAVQSGCALLSSHFHRIDIRPEDFDEDDDPTFRPDPIFEPLDAYINRQLPCLIGSSTFFARDHVGLVDEDESAPESPLHKAPVAVPTVASEAVDVDVPLDAQHEESAASAPIAVEAAPAEKASSDSSGLFGGSEGSNDSADLFANTPAVRHAPPVVAVRRRFGRAVNHVAASQAPPMPNLMDELSARLASDASHKTKPSSAASTAPPPATRPAAATKQQSVHRLPSRGDSDEPPPLPPAASESLRATTTTGIFQTRTGGLFDDDDEARLQSGLRRHAFLLQDDLFSLPKQPTRYTVVASTNPPPSRPVVQVRDRGGGGGGGKSAAALFDGDTEDDDADMFAPAPLPAAAAPVEVCRSAAAFFDIQSLVKVAKAKSIAQPVAKQPQRAAAVAPSHKSIFDDEDTSDSDDIFNLPSRQPREEPSIIQTAAITTQIEKRSNESADAPQARLRTSGIAQTVSNHVVPSFLTKEPSVWKPIGVEFSDNNSRGDAEKRQSNCWADTASTPSAKSASEEPLADVEATKSADNTVDSKASLQADVDGPRSPLFAAAPKWRPIGGVAVLPVEAPRPPAVEPCDPNPPAPPTSDVGRTSDDGVQREVESDTTPPSAVERAVSVESSLSSDSHTPLPSLTRSRARIPTSARRHASRRPADEALPAANEQTSAPAVAPVTASAGPFNELRRPANKVLSTANEQVVAPAVAPAPPSTGLFDDSDDEGASGGVGARVQPCATDIFADFAAKTAPKASERQDDVVSPAPPVARAIPAASQRSGAKPVKSLFDEDSDSDLDIFK